MNIQQLQAAIALGCRIQIWHLRPCATSSADGQWDTCEVRPKFECPVHLYRVHPDDLHLLRAGHKHRASAYFSADPAEGEFRIHDTLEAAREDAEGLLESAGDEAADWGWADDPPQICYGAVLGSCHATSRKPAPPGSDFSELVEYALRPCAHGSAIMAALDEPAGSVDGSSLQVSGGGEVAEKFAAYVEKIADHREIISRGALREIADFIRTQHPTPAPDGGEAVAYAVFARSHECPKPVMLKEYVGSMDVVRSRVMEKARKEGFDDDFVTRMAELGWWLEPLYTHPAPPTLREAQAVDLEQFREAVAAFMTRANDGMSRHARAASEFERECYQTACEDFDTAERLLALIDAQSEKSKRITP